MTDGRKYKVYGIPEKSLKDFRMGGQFEVEPDQKFRLIADEIENAADEDNKGYEDDRDKMIQGMMEQNPNEFNFDNRDSF